MTSPQVALPAPSSRARRPFDFRIPITLCVIAVLCGVFWLGSRYPSLQGKASADPDEALSTPLGFESYFPEPSRRPEGQAHLWMAAEWARDQPAGDDLRRPARRGLLTLLPLLPRTRGGSSPARCRAC